ncbi:MAG: hypothetical protein HYV19_01020 [Gemmatimonadetes bacterium]|nr:hypothetical protein [Gemmatimonadota bacterium]
MTEPAARTDAPRKSASRLALRRPAWLGAAVAAGVVLACAIASITPDPIGVFGDDGVYLLTAKALAAGDGYRYLHLPGAPPAIHFPPIFPLLLALLLKLTPAFPANVAVLKLLNPVCLAIGVFGLVRFAERRLDRPRGPAAVAVVVCAVAAPVLVLANVRLSETLFLAVFVGGVLLPVAALVLWARQRRREAIVLAVCTVAGGGSAFALRARP